MDNSKVTKNDTVILIPKSKKIKQKICIKIEDDHHKIPGLGVYNPIKLVDIEYGSCITLGNEEYWILPSNTIDHIDSMTRKAQIILPKDAALISVYSDIRPGAHVVEGGVGSGALTIILLTLVGPNGKVTTYENNSKFAKVGAENINNANLSNNWQLKQQDITKGINENNQDAVILDIPEPWLALDTASVALRPGGTFTSYLPTMNQVERLVNALKAKPFIEIRSFETLYRNLVVGAGGTRPDFDMLGHTGYITIARKVLEQNE